MNEENKNFLLRIARNAIESQIKKERFELGTIPKELKEVTSCFVTLTKNDDLRGCIGHLEGFEPLYENVIRNAVNSALNDSRFPPVTEQELNKIKIEISVLTKPEKLYYDDADDLLKKLSSQQGVIIKKGMHQATFLPQVWEMFSEKEEFLKNLSAKAGLHPDSWRENPEIYVYEVIKFSE